jgi:probable rRNA maturation factor
MSVTVDITISEDIESADDDVPEPALLKSWASTAYLDDTSRMTPAVASLMVTTAEEIQHLNKQYRDKDKPTNVLSFPMDTPEDLDVNLLGDIALCASVINSEAGSQSKPKEAHWAHMVVHGMLHLQGFDHDCESEAEVMEQKEIEILDKLGFQNPYITEQIDSGLSDRV